MEQAVNNFIKSRRRFIAGLTSFGLGSALLPAALRAQAQGGKQIMAPALKDALAVSGVEIGEAEQQAMLAGVNQNLARYTALHGIDIPNDVAPPFYFSPIVPGMKVNKTREPIHFSTRPTPMRPKNLEEVAFWPLSDLAQLLKTRQVSSVELTRMYLARLHKYNDKINCVVTFLDDLALKQATQADAEIAAGHYKGPMHGMPWGAKDIIAVKGYKTTWGSGAYKDQYIDEEASVVVMLREAGAVLLAKLSTGELAGGDQWFGGRTNNPWNLDEGSSGSSAGPASSTAAGLVPFAIGTETGGSILSPSGRCGATGLRPTFGRVSRHGVMALAWTQDRLGPICRHVEDCALVMSVIARPDDLDLSVSEIPFNWDARRDYRKLRVGYFADAFDDADRNPEWRHNDAATLAQLRTMGVELIPLKVPDFPIDILAISVEAAVFFDGLLRSGRDELLTAKNKAERFRVSRVVPAVEYLQSQRLRTMMMQKLAEATAGVDVYLAPHTNGNPRSGGADGPSGPANTPQPPPNRTQQHSQMANLACYPGLALPNGFAANGTPTSINFMARPFGEPELLVLAKAYQDATGFNSKQPPLFAV
ncbi:MAG: Amidase [Nevskia sp.]|nr:Amidase [Nevskia sp.]